MKKVLSAFLLTLAVLGLALGAYAEEEADTLMLELNIQAVKANLDDHELHYTQQGDQNDVFKLNYNLDGTLNSGKLWIFVYDDGVRFEADYDVSATEEVRGELAAYLSELNSKLRMCSFYLEEDGTIGNGYFLYTDLQVPTQDILGDCRVTVLSNLESYSEAIADILYGGKTAAEVL